MVRAATASPLPSAPSPSSSRRQACNPALCSLVGRLAWRRLRPLAPSCAPRPRTQTSWLCRASFAGQGALPCASLVPTWGGTKEAARHVTPGSSRPPCWGGGRSACPRSDTRSGFGGACPDQGEQSPARGVAWERAAVLGMSSAWRAQRSSQLREGGAEPASRAPAAAPRAAAANRACRGAPARALTEPCAPGPPAGHGRFPCSGSPQCFAGPGATALCSFWGPQGPGPAWPRGVLRARGIHAPLSLCGRLLWFLLPQPLSEAPPGSRALSVCLSVCL